MEEFAIAPMFEEEIKSFPVEAGVKCAAQIYADNITFLKPIGNVVQPAERLTATTVSDVPELMTSAHIILNQD